ncbi:MAG: hypothetical protein WA993_09185 [Candidatus Binatus sp.]|uniref:hypothetical protein n=1 Tax=Candidatus Binatus sp. TaxID=2811406 RepID=UPI003CBAF958
MPQAEAIVREAGFDDFEAVRSLRLRFGLGDDSPQDWRSLWLDNPALARTTHLPIGWVLEAERRIVGFVGSIPTQVAFGEQTLLAVSAHAMTIEPEYRRSYRLSLNAPLFSLEGVDLVLNTSANYGSGRIVQAFGAVPVPSPDYDRSLFWVLRPGAFLRAYLRRRVASRLLAAALGWCGAGLLAADRVVRRRRPTRPGGATDLSICEIDQIGEEFDGLWARKTREPLRLMSVRTAETLRWHFRQSPGAHWAKAVCCSRAGRLAGYAIIMRQDAPDVGLARIRIADLLAENDDPEVIDDLLWASYQQARRDRVSVLELVGFPGTIRARLARGKPYSRQLDAWPYFYRAARTELQARLGSEQAWYACPYDGDDTILAAVGSQAPAP